ncbi:MAG: hypothetical protein ACYTKD_03905, partial [Planctomycetota bacterium]
MSETDARGDGRTPGKGPASASVAAEAAGAGASSLEAPSVRAESRRGRVRLAARALLSVAAALLATEGLLRVVIPPEDAFGFWFPRGVHTPDAKYGFVFTPGFRGVMSHPDGVPCVPLAPGAPVVFEEEAAEPDGELRGVPGDAEAGQLDGDESRRP